MPNVFYDDVAFRAGPRKKLPVKVGSTGKIIDRFSSHYKQDPKKSKTKDYSFVPTERDDVYCPMFLGLKWAYGCPGNCAWCYLQGTLRMLPDKTEPKKKDFDVVKRHLKHLLQEEKRLGGHSELLNSGEIADSLMFEGTEWSLIRNFGEMFDRSNHYKLLTLSKFTNVEELITGSYNNVITSWTVNSETAWDRWEKNTPSITKRLEAAAKCMEAGYSVRLRIDPIVPYDGFEKDYRALVYKIMKILPEYPERVTIGTPRLLSSTRNAIIANNGDLSWITISEDQLEETSFGKRYPLSLRLKAYRTVINALEDYSFHEVAICKDTLRVFDELGMNFRAQKCNCIP